MPTCDRGFLKTGAMSCSSLCFLEAYYPLPSAVSVSGLLTLCSVEDPFSIVFHGLHNHLIFYLVNIWNILHVHGRPYILGLLTILSVSLDLWDSDVNFVASQEFVADIW